MLDGSFETKGSSENKNTIYKNYNWHKILEASKANSQFQGCCHCRAVCAHAVCLHRSFAT